MGDTKTITLTDISYSYIEDKDILILNLIGDRQLNPVFDHVSVLEHQIGDIRIGGYYHYETSLSTLMKEYTNDINVNKYPVWNPFDIGGDIYASKYGKNWVVKISNIYEDEILYYSRKEILEWIKSGEKKMPDEVYLKMLKRTNPGEYKFLLDSREKEKLKKQEQEKIKAEESKKREKEITEKYGNWENYWLEQDRKRTLVEFLNLRHGPSHFFSEKSFYHFCKYELLGTDRLRRFVTIRLWKNNEEYLDAQIDKDTELYYRNKQGVITYHLNVLYRILDDKKYPPNASANAVVVDVDTTKRIVGFSGWLLEDFLSENEYNFHKLKKNISNASTSLKNIVSRVFEKEVKTKDILSELEKLESLKSAGTITEEEFNILKNRILNN
jgi:hypothetical protein